MRGLVFLATTKINDGDELLMDYRLKPSNELPSWYSHVDEDEASRRWEILKKSENKNESQKSEIPWLNVIIYNKL